MEIKNEEMRGRIADLRDRINTEGITPSDESIQDFVKYFVFFAEHTKIGENFVITYSDVYNLVKEVFKNPEHIGYLLDVCLKWLSEETI